jgi:hypothetical protein
MTIHQSLFLALLLSWMVQCLTTAKQAIDDHHIKYGFKWEWITEVKTTG